MTHAIADDLLTAGTALADVLTRENAALEALDLAGAAALYGEKAARAAAFAAAQRGSADAGATPPDAATHAAAQALAARLRDLAEANKRLLERGIFVQGRVVATIARALTKAAPPAQASRYAAGGVMARSGRQQAVMLSARA